MTEVFSTCNLCTHEDSWSFLKFAKLTLKEANGLVWFALVINSANHSPQSPIRSSIPTTLKSVWSKTSSLGIQMFSLRKVHTQTHQKWTSPVVSEFEFSQWKGNDLLWKVANASGLHRNMHTHTHMCTHTGMHTHAEAQKLVHIYTHSWVHTHRGADKNTHTLLGTHTLHKHTNMCTHTYTHTSHTCGHNFWWQENKHTWNSVTHLKLSLHQLESVPRPLVLRMPRERKWKIQHGDS